MQDVQKSIEEYNVDKERKILIVFDDIIADMFHNKKTKFNSNRIAYQKQKIKHFSFFYHTTIF